jgi:glycosyltransferase involved in cell wall biosynthesis
LANCRILVVPLESLVRSTGQSVILEGMAFGKPVIATRTTGTVDYIQSGINGVLVPTGDPVALRNAIKAVIDTPSLERNLSINGFETVKANHTYDIYVTRILEAADKIVMTV